MKLFSSHSRCSQGTRQGMALVITLILLSVTLVMAVAFLALARRERASVTTSTDSTLARLATDNALAAAQAQILANLQTSTNATLYSYGLLVSTNYINNFGFIQNSQSPTNVNFDYYTNGAQPLLAQDFNQSIANLMILPRAPVLLSTNDPKGRFYLDLNRNGLFDDTGSSLWNAIGSAVTKDGLNNVKVLNNLVTTNGTIAQVGDPQWVGILERPNQVHSADNQFLSRYAFAAVPVGEGLDVNYLHNQVETLTVNGANGVLSGPGDGYMRNQSVGSWEINLAAFLADLNTNQWLPSTAPDNNYYGFYEPYGVNRGVAFDDARAMLSYRYNYSYSYPNLFSADRLFFNFNYLKNDNVDEYSDGPLQVTTTNISEVTGPQDPISSPWAGSDTPNKFYTPDDFFDAGKFPVTAGLSFPNRLVNAGATTDANGVADTYDRYTFYRMLEQLGTESVPNNVGKLNLNYQNAFVTNGVDGQFIGMGIVSGAETNLYPWNARDFFCAAADMLLRNYSTNWFQANPSNYLINFYGVSPADAVFWYTNKDGLKITNDPNGFGLVNVPFVGITNQIPAFGLANIPAQIYSNTVYSTAVNRLLQLAANILDASTNSFYPHVFRPVLLVTNQYAYRNGSIDLYRNIYICGYEDISAYAETHTLTYNTAPMDLPVMMSQLNFGVLGGLNQNLTGWNVYDLPWIIGAKK
ncbi:MAG TPA: hypothetical protein VF607_00425, partial [Verrucomicrobiae bacterium]